MNEYTEYKPASCDWIEEVPSSWKVQRIKTLFRLRDERNYKPLSEVNLISLYARLGVRQHKDIEHTTGNKARNADGYKIVYPEDIVVNILLCWMGAIGRSEYYGVTSPAYDIYRPIVQMNTKYYDYLFRSPAFSQQCYRYGKGIMAMRWRTYSPQFSNIVVPVPSKEEQNAIVAYLDWQVSKINKLIAIYKRQIKVVQERKQATINEAVLNGFNYSDLIMPKTGEKINVPEGWTLCALKYKADIYNGNSMSNKAAYEVETSIPYVATKDIDSATGNTNYRNGLFVPENSDFKISPTGSTLLCIEGGSAGRKKTLVKQNTAYVNKLCAFIPKDIDSKYLYYYICSDAFAEQFRVNITGLIGGVSISTIKRMLILVPSAEMQKEVAKKLDNECEANDEIIKSLNEKVRLLHELRDSVISDAVLGKIDIRGIAIPDYEYVDEEADSETDEDSEETEEQED